MKLTDHQIDVIGRRIPAILDRARSHDPRIHSVGIGRKISGGEPLQDHVIVFFVVDRGTPPSEVDVGEALTFEIDGQSVSVDTAIVETTMPVFAACSKERPVRGGNCVATAGTGLTGSVGGAIVGPDKKKHYLISAAHLLTDFGSKDVEDDCDVIQPSDDADEKIGKLSHAGPDWPPFGGNMDADAALASVPGGTADISYDIPGIGTIAGTTPPKEAMDVHVRGAQMSATEKVAIRYVRCASTVSHNQKEYTFRNVFFTARISAQGDSGALAVEKKEGSPGKVAGLLFAHCDKFTMYADVDDCIDVLQISGWHWGKPPA